MRPLQSTRSINYRDILSLGSLSNMPAPIPNAKHPSHRITLHVAHLRDTPPPFAASVAATAEDPFPSDAARSGSRSALGLCCCFARGFLMPYEATTQMPRMPMAVLNSSATMPLKVKLSGVSAGCDYTWERANRTHPAGNGGGGVFSPERSRKSAALPAALPLYGTLPDMQTSRWFSGSWIVACSSRGSSTKVAMRPDATCHSMWQWNSQTPTMC